MTETRIANVEGLLSQGALGPKSYTLVVTNTRSILVLQSSSKAAIGAALGGALGAATAQVASGSRGVDADLTPLDELARDPKNIVIPHGAINRMRVKKSWGTYRLAIEYISPGEKRRKIKAEVSVSSQGAKKLGISVNAFSERRGNEVRDAYRRALPPEIRERVQLED